MIIFPAIDIRGGKCVRLLKGDFAKETVFSDKPEEMAKKWQAQGAEFLHLVDLDGALAGKPQNLATVKAILAAVDIPVELGGGIRTLESIDEVLALGVRRVILGSVAVRDPDRGGPRREHADAAVEAGEEVGDRHADLQRRAVRGAGQRHDAAHRLHQRVVAGGPEIVQGVVAVVDQVHGVFIFFQHDLQRSCNGHFILCDQDSHGYPLPSFLLFYEAKPK